MSEHPTFDRAKGFVALPVEVLEIDLTPGAFRLLVELCRMANADGFCWPSLDQLSDRLGRSKSAISGYIKDLRAADLVTTQEQKTANGYNYRLKYQVTFWKDWRASLTGKATMKTERSVQQDERLKESKKQSHLNQTTPAAVCVLDNLLNDWAACFRGAPYPRIARYPSAETIMKSEAAVNAAKPSTHISADIITALAATWTKLRVTCTAETLGQQAALLVSSGYSELDHERLTHHIEKTWEAHWRRAPTDEQFAKLVKSAKIVTDQQKRNLLKSHLKRWALAQKTLQKTQLSDCLGATRPTAKMAAG